MDVTALSMNKFGFHFKKLTTKDQRAELLFENRRSVLFVDNLLRHKNRSVLARSAVVAAIIKTFEKNKEDALAFWESVRDGVMLKEEDPAMVLRRYLYNCQLKKPNPASRVVTQDAHKETFSKCIHAWNAWRSGQKTELRYSHKSPVPEAK